MIYQKNKIKLKFLLAGIFSVLYIPLIADNIILIPIISGYTYDTISIDVEISNDDPFTAFQCDVVLPESVTFIENSATLTNRSVDHFLYATLLPENKLRLFAFSPNNTTFSGQNGSVAVFSIFTGDIPGQFLLPIENALIADTLSQNICTGTVTGMLDLLQTDIAKTTLFEDDISVFPNPFVGELTINFNLPEKSIIDISILSLFGEELYHKECFIEPSNSNSQYLFIKDFQNLTEDCILLFIEFKDFSKSKLSIHKVIIHKVD